MNLKFVCYYIGPRIPMKIFQKIKVEPEECAARVPAAYNIASWRDALVPDNFAFPPPSGIWRFLF